MVSRAPRTCVVCGMEYTPSSNNQKVCSKVCKAVRKAELDRAWEERNREVVREYHRAWLARQPYEKRLEYMRKSEAGRKERERADPELRQKRYARDKLNKARRELGAAAENG